MKVADLRKKLATLKQEEVIKLAVEFYKLVPKAKKEDYQLDEMINNPSEQNPKKTAVSTSLNLSAVEDLVNKFEKNAKAENYLYSNRSVPKKERSTWRFKVRKWYKELVNVKRKDADLVLQAELLEKLYELLSEGSHHNYFRSDMPFKSVGVSQRDFYKSILVLWQAAGGKQKAIDKGISLMVAYSLDEETYFNELVVEFISCLPIPDLKEAAIAKTLAAIKALNFVPKPKKASKMGGFIYYFDNRTQEEKDKEIRNNCLSLLGFHLHFALHEYDEAITFFKTHFYEEKVEVQTQKLIVLLFDEGLKDETKKEIETAVKNGIELNERLLQLLAYIKKHDVLPDNLYDF